MMYWHYGWSWFWMIPMMLVWALALGAVVYAAVRLAGRDKHEQSGTRHQRGAHQQ